MKRGTTLYRIKYGHCACAWSAREVLRMAEQYGDAKAYRSGVKQALEILNEHHDRLNGCAKPSCCGGKRK